MVQEVHMHDEAAHPSQPFSSPVKQLGDFFKQSVKEWVKAINSGGFISLQVRRTRTAFGLPELSLRERGLQEHG